jgi:hypothetical protein
METKLEKEVRFLKIYAVVATLFCAMFFLTAFSLKNGEQKFEEITANRIKIVDANGKVGLLLAADYKKDAPGVFFFNQEGTESGALFYHGTRDKDGKINAYSLLTMDQYKSDQIVVLQYDHMGDQKRYGLVINDRPDTIGPQAEKLLEDLRVALQSAKTDEEAQALRKEYLSKLPAREIVARRLFAGRDVEGAAQLTLSDPDGKPRMQLKVDNAGKASITFLDSSGKVVRTIKP